jgi:hypothetical protein
VFYIVSAWDLLARDIHALAKLSKNEQYVVVILGAWLAQR